MSEKEKKLVVPTQCFDPWVGLPKHTNIRMGEKIFIGDIPK